MVVASDPRSAFLYEMSKVTSAGLKTSELHVVSVGSGEVESLPQDCTVSDEFRLYDESF